MSYIGRGTDAISNVEKLDNITFNGGTTYALTKSSAAFTPSSSNAILISIDGVVQQGNFSVSTTNIVFDWSPTSSNTCDWIMHFGVGVLNTPADDTVSTAKIADGAVTAAKIADGTVVASEIADNAITTAKINADAVTGAKIADDQINSEHYVDGSIDNAHIADDQIDSEHYVDGSIDTAHIGNLQVTTAKIAADAIDGTKLADDAVDSEHYTDASIDNAHLADDAVGIAELSATGTASSSTFLRGDNSWVAVTGTTINNNADNRIITGSGTANTLEGESTFTYDGTNLDLGDSKKIRLGASQDLQIYHDGSNSWVDDLGTGNLKIRTSQADILSHGGESMIIATANGAVELYYNNVKKLETSSAGGTLTGTWTGAGSSTDEQAVGTYHLSYYGASGETIVEPGGTTAGSNLYDDTSQAFNDFSTRRHDGAGGDAYNTGYSGTWRSMHVTDIRYRNGYRPTGLFVRVS